VRGLLKIFDVSMLITDQMIVYPGNPLPEILQYSSIPKNKTNESTIRLGSHCGSHVDTKRHIRNEGKGSESLPLDSFYGECEVFDLSHIENEVHKKDLENFTISRGDIILLKTKNSILGYREFRKDFVYLKLDAALYLINLGIKTLGFDYLSVKKFGSDDEVHKVLIDNFTLFEGLNLSKVPEGKYVFAGLPLKVDCDGAPARIILIKKQQNEFC
jgi:arylformamidase